MTWKSQAKWAGPALLLSMTLLWRTAHSDLATIQQMPLPDSAVLEMVGVDIEHNASRVSIALFSSDWNVTEVLDFYRETWVATEDHPGHVYRETGDWKIVAHLARGINLALQLQADGQGGTSGLVSALDVSQAGNVGFDEPPLPPGAELLSSTSSTAGNRRASTWMLRFPGRPGEAAGFYIGQLEREGWDVVADRSNADPAVVLLSSNRGTFEVVASSNASGSFVLLNQVTSGQLSPRQLSN